MDRKMDSGVLSDGESLDGEYDVTRNLLPEEILGIIDQLLCLEVSIVKTSLRWRCGGLRPNSVYRWHGISDIHYRRRS